MIDPSGSDDREYADEDAFPRLEGKKMCPRCTCCEVGVGTFEPLVIPGVGTYERLVTPYWYLHVYSPLLPEPDPNLSAKWQAWFCKGGCDKKGKHGKGRSIPSFIGYINPRTIPE